MDETRAVANLPHVDIEIRHRRVPEEGAEYLSISLRATPDIDTAVSYFDPFRLLTAWVGLNPWFAWMRLMQPFAPQRLAAPTTATREVPQHQP